MGTVGPEPDNLTVVVTNELHLYDFDGTLFKAPDRPSWWGKTTWVVDSLSLGPPCVPLKPGPEWWISSAVGDAKKSIANPDVWAILCTGRALGSSHRYRVPELLKQKGLSFDEVYLNPGGDTKSYKIKVILRLLREFPQIEVVHIWENHLANMSAFCKAVEATGRECVEHPIKAQAPDPICTEEEVDRLQAEGWAKHRKASARRVADRFLGRGAWFISAQLTPMAQAKLLGTFPALHADVRADHMTVWYDPSEEVQEQLRSKMGKTVKLKVVGYAEDEKGQAVLIDTRLPSSNRQPHITISLSPGTKASYSNTLKYRKVVGPTLDAVLVLDR